MFYRIPLTLRLLPSAVLIAGSLFFTGSGAAGELVQLAAYAPDRPAQATAGPRASLGAGPLSERDAMLYGQIFALQEGSEWAAADELIANLTDGILLGHVLYQRYLHPTGWRSTYAELEAWLDAYADHPDAGRLYDLALKRRPGGTLAPQKPVGGYLAGAGQQVQEWTRIKYRSTRTRSAAEEALVRDWRRQIEDLAYDGRGAEALKVFERQDALRLLDRVEVDLVRWTIAHALFIHGQDSLAYRLAVRAAERSAATVPTLDWLAGISAWRLGKVSEAAAHFARLAEASRAPQVERSRAAFWAARAHLVSGQGDLVGHFLEIAARGTRDFYGLLARRVLGETMTYNFDRAAAAKGTLRVLVRFPGARRAMALGQIGQTTLAEREIRRLAPGATPDLLVGLIALAEQLHLPATQMRLAQRLGTVRGRHQHSALFPLPEWRPDSGLTLDQALIFAVIRAESAFDPEAESHVGAKGLMQVMPATARGIARIADLTPLEDDGLLNPEVSMAYGQAYLEHLLQYRSIGNNLIFLAAGYNAGPGRIPRWQERYASTTDPLLFLESIPIGETRIYVKKVLTNLWTYRARLGQAQPSLDALAANRWPTYEPLDARPMLHAWR